MDKIAPTQRIFIAGNSGTGKSTLAYKRFLSKQPRRIIIDLTGEWTDAARRVIPAEVVDEKTHTVAELAVCVSQIAHRGKWTIALSRDMDAADVEALVRWLLPVPQLERSPIRAVNGAVLLVDEVDLIAPMGPPTRPIRTLYRRSRHVGLSIVSTTQRPANVCREVSAQSTQAIALHLSEPRDQKYMVDLMNWPPESLAHWRRWTRQHPHGCYWKDLTTGEARWMDDSGALYPARPANASADFGSQLQSQADG